MPAELDQLLQDLSVYQDIVLAGRMERRGERDCEERWNVMAPHLPASGSLLDIGANFAWFCLRWCNEGADRTAVAWEADLRSAAVARYVLESNAARRTCLITARADARNLRTLVTSDSRFSVAFCLSVLHWLPDHRTFLRALGIIAPRILIEHCDPREEGAGIEQVRREIGFIGDYLHALFPERDVRRLAECKSHLTDQFARELWIVEQRDAETATDPSASAVSARALLELDAVWPPPTWWREELQRPEFATAAAVAFAPQGLTAVPTSELGDSRAEFLRLVSRMPAAGVTTWRRRMRRYGRSLLRRVHRES